MIFVHKAIGLLIFASLSCAKFCVASDAILSEKQTPDQHIALVRDDSVAAEVRIQRIARLIAQESQEVTEHAVESSETSPIQSTDPVSTFFNQIRGQQLTAEDEIAEVDAFIKQNPQLFQNPKAGNELRAGEVKNSISGGMVSESSQISGETLRPEERIARIDAQKQLREGNK